MSAEPRTAEELMALPVWDDRIRWTDKRTGITHERRRERAACVRHLTPDSLLGATAPDGLWRPVLGDDGRWYRERGIF